MLTSLSVGSGTGLMCKCIDIDVVEGARLTLP